jgi:hypothetical protein
MTLTGVHLAGRRDVIHQGFEFIEQEKWNITASTTITGMF